MPGLSLEAVALESGEAAPHAHARPRPVDASPLSGLIVISSSSAIWYFDVITVRHHHQPAAALVEETTANTHEHPHGVNHIRFNPAAISSGQRPQLNRRELSPAITESSRGDSRPTNAPCHRR
ncbi:hypothetical protein CFAM422_002716 [Trichoderma lentiforme]|uniref:Uncharacterized protein n=1 Tax=Trichoderma lentiforme TaxID=1567552 RepID=A0A9P4XKA1_9HYPO|nr:hypothetical protein CFAM422_002716 [Trichoderma lentiforme]